MGAVYVYEDVLPYLSDPKTIKDFIEEHKEKSYDELILEINKIITDSQEPYKTDLRIFLNALLKHK
jgi:hypothetical protein